MAPKHQQLAFQTHGRECLGCGKKGELHIHHRDRDRTNNQPRNLAPLCESCHSAVHHLSAKIDSGELKFVLCKGQGVYHLASCGMVDSDETFLLNIHNENSTSERIRNHLCGNCKSRLQKFDQWPVEQKTLSDILPLVDDLGDYDCLNCGNSDILLTPRYNYTTSVLCDECGECQKVVDVIREQDDPRDTEGER